MNDTFGNRQPHATLSVSQLNRQVRTLLESHFDFVWVEGEVSNFVQPSSGHWYFSLRDGNTQVRCAMFRNRNQRVRVIPENGMAVKVRARVSLYEGRGEFQLIVEHLEAAGTGALQVAFEKLKAKLQAEGLFATDHKQPLPDRISHIGVITSATGAAIHDILTVLARRCPSICVSLLPVAVQGADAAADIVGAIERANRWQRQGKLELDALIVGRGGGSMEDLWSFNEEAVARAIHASELPVVSAVGHEVDFSIADMVADVRAATPSAAAELVSPDQREWLERLLGLEQALLSLLQRQYAAVLQRLEFLRQRLRHPGSRLREQSQRLDDIEQRMQRAWQHRLAAHTAELALLHNRLQFRSPLPTVRQLTHGVSNHRLRLHVQMQQILQQHRARTEHLDQLLGSLSPQHILGRGYSILRDSSGSVVSDSASVEVGDALNAQLASGTLDVKILTKTASAKERD
ncbi:MAG: exodeoxyribonuclease VII large subunit [Pseudomonadota bacterium]